MRCWLLLPLALLLVSLLPLSLLPMLLLLSLSLTMLMRLTWAVIKHHTVPYSMCDIMHQADASL